MSPKFMSDPPGWPPDGLVQKVINLGLYLCFECPPRLDQDRWWLAPDLFARLQSLTEAEKPDGQWVLVLV